MATVFGLKNPTFSAKSDISIPKCTEGGWGGAGIQIFLENTNILVLPLKMF